MEIITELLAQPPSLLPKLLSLSLLSQSIWSAPPLNQLSETWKTPHHHRLAQAPLVFFRTRRPSTLASMTSSHILRPASQNQRVLLLVHLDLLNHLGLPLLKTLLLLYLLHMAPLNSRHLRMKRSKSHPLSRDICSCTVLVGASVHINTLYTYPLSFTQSSQYFGSLALSFCS